MNPWAPPSCPLINGSSGGTHSLVQVDFESFVFRGPKDGLGLCCFITHPLRTRSDGGHFEDTFVKRVQVMRRLLGAVPIGPDVHGRGENRKDSSAGTRLGVLLQVGYV